MTKNDQIAEEAWRKITADAIDYSASQWDTEQGIDIIKAAIEKAYNQGQTDQVSADREGILAANLPSSRQELGDRSADTRASETERGECPRNQWYSARGKQLRAEGWRLRSSGEKWNLTSALIERPRAAQGSEP